MHGQQNIKKSIVRQVGHLQELYWDARSREHKILKADFNVKLWKDLSFLKEK